MDPNWNFRAEQLAEDLAQEKSAKCQLMQMGTNATFRVGEELLRISRPENQNVVERGWFISTEIQRIDPGLSPEPLWCDQIDGMSVWAYRFIEGVLPYNFQELDRARQRTQKALAFVDPWLLEDLSIWPGPLRSFAMYTKELSKKAPSFIVDELRNREAELDTDVRAGSWSGEEIIIHGDFSIGNCIQTNSGNVLVFDWDCVQRGPFWADLLKLWHRGPQEDVPAEYAEWVRASRLARDAFEAFSKYCLNS